MNAASRLLMTTRPSGSTAAVTGDACTAPSRRCTMRTPRWLSRMNWRASAMSMGAVCPSAPSGNVALFRRPASPLAAFRLLESATALPRRRALRTTNLTRRRQGNGHRQRHCRHAIAIRSPRDRKVSPCPGYLARAKVTRVRRRTFVGLGAAAAGAGLAAASGVGYGRHVEGVVAEDARGAGWLRGRADEPHADRHPPARVVGRHHRAGRGIDLRRRPGSRVHPPGARGAAALRDRGVVPPPGLQRAEPPRGGEGRRRRRARDRQPHLHPPGPCLRDARGDAVAAAAGPPVDPRRRGPSSPCAGSGRRAAA